MRKKNWEQNKFSRLVGFSPGPQRQRHLVKSSLGYKGGEMESKGKGIEEGQVGRAKSEDGEKVQREEEGGRGLEK